MSLSTLEVVDIGQNKQNANFSVAIMLMFNVVSVCLLFGWHIKFIVNRVKAQLAQARLYCKMLLQL